MKSPFTTNKSNCNCIVLNNGWHVDCTANDYHNAAKLKAGAVVEITDAVQSTASGDSYYAIAIETNEFNATARHIPAQFLKFEDDATKAEEATVNDAMLRYKTGRSILHDLIVKANYNIVDQADIDNIASRAVRLTDAFLRELNKPQVK
jgi:hypothetical protein